uniref:Uncharacterized protein n=1 Tax=viral metagenome TaxID=1070528 RepID=A0A6C0HL89_9ZZZZ
MKFNNIISFYINFFKILRILSIVSIAICATIIVYVIITTIIFKKRDKFDGGESSSESSIISNKMDRTQLYGSLFLDGLDTVIKNMTDPRISYDTKSIEVVRYSDVLL